MTHPLARRAKRLPLATIKSPLRLLSAAVFSDAHAHPTTSIDCTGLHYIPGRITEQ